MHLANKDLVRGIPKLSGQPKPICGEGMRGKQVKGSHKKIPRNNTSRPLDLLHMDLMGPIHTESKGRKKYILVVIDNFSKYSFVSSLK